MLQKRIFSLLTAVCLIISLAACAQSNAPANASQAAQESAAATQEQASAAPPEASSAAPESEAPASAAANQDRVDLVFYIMGDPPKDQKIVEDAINEKLLEKLNATVTFQFSTWTDFQQKYATELTSGSPDLIYIANWLNYGQLSAAGAFLELDGLLDQYAPELKELAGESMLNQCRVDGELYAIPNLWPEYVPSGIS
jgi:putative aldouronate transport system substrate-binding protein